MSSTWKRRVDELKQLVMASSNRTLNSLGKLLILLDNCCNAQISSWSDLLSAIYGNSGSGANALGGVYCPKLKGDSPYIGCSLYDKDAEVTALSYKQTVDAGRVYHDKHENYGGRSKKQLLLLIPPQVTHFILLY